MKTNRFLIVVGLVLGFSGMASAAPCDGNQACSTPGTGAITGHTITTIAANVRNSNGTANVTNSIFYFEATTAGSASTVADPANGTVVIVGIQYFGSGVANDLIAGQLQPVVGGTTYNVFVRACPSGGQVSDPDCSAWVSLGSVGTTAYPANAGFPNVASADTAPQQFTARTTGVQDASNVLAWQVTINNNDAKLGAGSSSQLTQQPFSGSGSGAGSFLLDNGDYASLLPNLGYTLTERLIYFYNKPGPNFTTGTFFTQAATPKPGTVASITHCSATLPYQNAVANPANPNDTTYSINIGGPVSSGSATQTNVIGGTGQATDADSVSYTNLQAGQAYSPVLTATNRGGASWRSASANFAGFTTVAWGGTFSVTPASIGTTSADFVASGVNTAGVQTWQLVTVPAVAGLPSGTAVDLNGTHTMTGLLPNTQYTVQIQISEASGCSSSLPITPLGFTSDAAVPTNFNLTANSPTQIQGTWNDGVNNTVTTSYQVQYCLDAGFSSGCATQNTAINVLNATINSLTPETNYFAHVKARATTGGVDSAFSNSDSVVTPNQAPSVVSGPTVQVWQTSATLTFVATDNGGPTHLSFNWTVNPSGTGNPTLTSASGVTSIAGQNASNVTHLTFSLNGTYSGNVTVTDHDGTGMPITRNWSTGAASQVPTQIVISPTAQTVITGNSFLFNAFVCDQFETPGNCSASSTHLISGQTVNWSVSGGGTPLTQNGTASYTFNATTPNSPNPPYTLTASFSGASNGTAAITVLAAGPQFNSFTFSMAPGNKGGTLTVVGHDNVVHSINSTFSASDPSVVFNPNSRVSADNIPGTSAVTFSKSGTFTLTDNLGFGISSSTVVIVPQILSKIVVSPDNVTISLINSQTFSVTGYDQFNNVMPVGAVTWSGSGISGAGVFRANTIGSNIQINATVTNSLGQQIVAHATVNVINYDISAAHPFPNPWKSTAGVPFCFTGLGSSSKIRIYTISGRLVFSTDVAPSAPGNNTCDYSWNVKNNSGESLASGVYLFVIESPTTTKNGKIIIIQ